MSINLRIVALVLLLGPAIVHVCNCNNTTNFDIVPTNVTQAEGLNAVFECRYNGSIPILAYFWEINNVSTTITIPRGVRLSTIPAGDGGRTIQTLMFPAIAEYNGTFIVCSAFLGSSIQTERTTPTSLIVQGHLDHVGNLQVVVDSISKMIIISWDAPFSLDITDTEPDITYCVDVYSLTFNLTLHLLSTCNHIETMFSLSPLINRVRTCDILNITVIAVNGAGNGSTSGVLFESASIMFIEDILVSSNFNNAIEMTAVFSNDTCINVTDVFVIVAPLLESDTLHVLTEQPVYSLVLSIGIKATRIENVHPGRYSVLIYDLGGDGLLQITLLITPIAKREVKVIGMRIDDLVAGSSDIITSNIQQQNDSLEVFCIYQQNLSDSESVEGCLVIVQFIGTLEEFAQLNVYTIRRSEGSQLLVDLERQGDYLVTVFPMTERGIIGSTFSHKEIISVEFILPTTSTTTLIKINSNGTTNTAILVIIIAGSLTGLLVVIAALLSIICVVNCVVIKRQKNISQQPAGGEVIETKSCEAYNVVMIKRRQRQGDKSERGGSYENVQVTL